MRRIIIILTLILLIGTVTSYGDVNAPYRNGFIEGYLKARTEDKVQIEEYDGTIHDLPIKAEANIVIDNIPVKIMEFKPGMEVYGELQGKSLTYLESYSTQNPGYIPPGSKLRIGNIKSIDRDMIIIITPTGDEETYFTSMATIALKKGENVPLSNLYVGDRVKLYFDEIDTSYISRVEIQGDSVLIKDLYRGKINITDSLQDVITLENVELLDNGKWQNLANGMKISYDASIPLYVGGREVPYNNLKYYKGKTVYMAVKSFFGKNKVERMVIKNQYESMYSEKIKDVNWYTQEIELENNKNISFNEGTMIIKGGRLVDSYSINVSQDTLVVADGRGSDLTADIIYIYNEEINNSNIGQNLIYAGRLDAILEDNVKLKDFFLLDRNEWESFDDEKELFYDQDTFIYDLEDEKLISSKEFYAGDYAVDEDSSRVKRKNLKDWYGYIYADGDRINTIVVQKSMDSLLKQRVSTGSIESIVDDSMVGWTMTLHDVKDWSNHHNQWMNRTVTTRINLEKAMIIKNNKMITPEDLQARDRLYIVRDDFIGKVILVK